MRKATRINDIHNQRERDRGEYDHQTTIPETNERGKAVAKVCEDMGVDRAIIGGYNIGMAKAKHGRQGEGGGRPQFDGKPYEVVLQKLREAWAMGCPDCEACALADISAASLSDFLKRNPKVAEEKARLLENPFLVARKSILAAMPADPELALKYMERKKKHEFSTKSETEHSGIVSLEQLISQATTPKPDKK